MLTTLLPFQQNVGQLVARDSTKDTRFSLHSQVPLHSHTLDEHQKLLQFITFAEFNFRLLVGMGFFDNIKTPMWLYRLIRSNGCGGSSNGLCYKILSMASNDQMNIILGTFAH